MLWNQSEANYIPAEDLKDFIIKRAQIWSEADLVQIYVQCILAVSPPSIYLLVDSLFFFLCEKWGNTYLAVIITKINWNSECIVLNMVPGMW